MINRSAYNYKLLIKISITLFSLYVVSGYFDISVLRELYTTLTPEHVLLLSSLFFLAIFAQAFRWNIILKYLYSERTLNLWYTIKLTFVGSFLNQVLPGAVSGDAYRILKSKHCAGGLTNAIHAVMIDRLCALFILLVILVGSTALEPDFIKKLINMVSSRMNGYGQDNYLWYGLTFVILSSSGVCLLLKFKHHLDFFISCLLEYTKNPKLLFYTFSLSLLGQLLVSYVVLILSDLTGSYLTFLQIVTIWPIVTILMLLPISIAGWGVRESALMFIYSMFGQPMTNGLVVSISFGLLSLICSFPGMFFMHNSQNRWSKEKVLNDG